MLGLFPPLTTTTTVAPGGTGGRADTWDIGPERQHGVQRTACLERPGVLEQLELEHDACRDFELVAVQLEGRRPS